MRGLKLTLDVAAAMAQLTMRTLRQSLSVLLLVWLVLSHTVGWAADLTSAILRTGFSVVSTSAAAKAETTRARARAGHLESELAVERRQRVNIEADLGRANAQGAELRRELAQTQARLDSRRASFDRVNLELQASRRQTAQLQTRLRQPTQHTVSFRGQTVAAEDAVQHTLNTVSRRTARVTSSNVGSVFAESIPYFGVGVIVTATSYELWSACANMRDLHDLQVAFAPETAATDDRDRVCGLQVPTTGEIWTAVRESPSAVWRSGVFAMENTRGSLGWVRHIDLPDFPMPDFGLAYEAAVAGLASSRGALSDLKDYELSVRPLSDVKEDIGTIGDWMRSWWD